MAISLSYITLQLLQHCADADTHHPLWAQDVYHTAVDDVDIAIIWPQDHGDLETYFKPVTRLVYWWSHGVPVIFYPTQVRACLLFVLLGVPLYKSIAELMCQLN